jgi:hypothetical protein
MYKCYQHPCKGELLYGINTIICFKKYRKILFDETLYGYIDIPFFLK